MILRRHMHAFNISICKFIANINDIQIPSCLLLRAIIIRLCSELENDFLTGTYKLFIDFLIIHLFLQFAVDYFEG